MNMSVEEMKARGINPVTRQLQGVTAVWENANYSRFYGLLRLLPGDKEEIKRQLVLQYTHCRTDSLKEVTRGEYYQICDRMRELVNQGGRRDAAREELRHQRSIALHLMQKMGVDTSDWNRVDALCQDPRIAGKMFRFLSVDELAAMTTKLRAIERKGGFRTFEINEPKATIVSINK